ncbi:MAG: hypothetical protein HY600_06100 [Candidatus Omnitrophica bacterium]|nr:hypothetical protein [Candidatus Omnitrophota bacterium]
MRASHRLIAGLWAGALVAAPSVFADAGSDTAEELRSLRRSVEALQKTLETQQRLIEQQQAKIEALEGKIQTSPTPVGMPPSVTTPSPMALPGQLGAALPEIGLLADIVATSSQDGADADGNDRIAAREVELIVSGYVDPYSRLDATFAFSDFEAADVEEAYLTHWGIPGGLKGRFGRFFPKIGKAAAIHRDQLWTVDEPIVVRKYFGAEGYFRSGADLTRVFGGPAGWVLEPSVGLLEGGVGEGATTFGSSRRQPTLYSHLKTFKDLSDAANVEVGLSHLIGSRDSDGRFEVNVLGVDATYLNALTPTTKLKLQGEFYLQHRDEAYAIHADTGATTQFDRHPWGAYLQADYRFAPRWSVGGRADHVRLLDTAAPRHADQGLSAFLTFYQSEWARWRLQYRHEERANAKTDDAVFLQGTVAIGAHKHQLQ